MSKLLSQEWYQTATKGKVAIEAIKAKGKINTPDESTNETPIMFAARYASNMGVINAMSTVGADPHLRNNDGLSAFSLAILHNPNLNIANDLIMVGAEINNREGEYEYTPLMLACSKDVDPVVIKFLLDCSSRIATTSRITSASALHIAAACASNALVIDLLLEDSHGIAILNKADGRGYTPLMCACKSNPNPMVILALMLYKSNSDHKAADGASAKSLLEANDGAKSKDPELYKQLLSGMSEKLTGAQPKVSAAVKSSGTGSGITISKKANPDLDDKKNTEEEAQVAEAPKTSVTASGSLSMNSPKAEEKKEEAPKAEETPKPASGSLQIDVAPKAEEKKEEAPKAEETPKPASDSLQIDVAPKAEEKKEEAPKAEETPKPASDSLQIDAAPKAEEKKEEAPKAEETPKPVSDSLQIDAAPKVEEKKEEAPKAEETPKPVSDSLQIDVAPKVEEKKEEAPKAEETPKPVSDSLQIDAAPKAEEKKEEAPAPVFKTATIKPVGFAKRAEKAPKDSFASQIVEAKKPTETKEVAKPSESQPVPAPASDKSVAPVFKTATIKPVGFAKRAEKAPKDSFASQIVEAKKPTETKEVAKLTVPAFNTATIKPTESKPEPVVAAPTPEPTESKPEPVVATPTPEPTAVAPEPTTQESSTESDDDDIGRPVLKRKRPRIG